MIIRISPRPWSPSAFAPVKRYLAVNTIAQIYPVAVVLGGGQDHFEAIEIPRINVNGAARPMGKLPGQHNLGLVGLVFAAA